MAEIAQQILQAVDDMFKATMTPAMEAVFVPWQTPVVFGIAYVVLETLLAPKETVAAPAAASGAAANGSGAAAGVAKKPKKSFQFTLGNILVLLHNLLLAFFSLFVFLLSYPIVLKRFQTMSLHDAYCDADRQFFAQMKQLSWVFYLSKYYEIVDTVILILKGKKPMFLQVYHHTGAIIAMWGLHVTDNPAVWLFVVLNSFIHTIMYFYYSLTVVGFNPPWKQLVTTLQLVQFVTGDLLAMKGILEADCLTTPQRYSLTFVVVYSWILIYLFYKFFKRAYAKKPAKKE